MCKYWSAIIDRNGKVWSDRSTSSHEELIKKAGLKDEKLENRDFVRIEIAPKKDILLFSKKPEDWAFRVDEKGTLPEWYLRQCSHFERQCWTEWKVSLKATLWKLDFSAVMKFISSLKKIRYFKPDGKPKKEWKLFEANTWDAAWAAAGAAAGDAALMARILMCNGLKLDIKHKKHAEARMKVWQKGYGLRCDVNGVLYVYAKKG